MKKGLLFLVVLAILVAGVVEWGIAAFNAPGPAARSGNQTVVIIKSGAGVHGTSQALAAAGVLQYPQVFEIEARLSGKSSAIKAGEYAIPSRASMRDILDELVQGKSIEHKVTIAEGLTSQMAYDIVKDEPALKGDAGLVPPEGSLLPETYLFQRGETRKALLAKMHAAQEKLIDELWNTRAAGLPIKTKEEAIILASIVEKETGIASERPHIASVFMNRLRIGMRLQSDPTIIYGITRGYPIGRRIKQSEIEAATPYNTYVITGLPPQPICNPGKDSIAAVLNPLETKDLYFVADGSGGHVFATNADDQARNVAKWRRIHIRDAEKPQ